MTAELELGYSTRKIESLRVSIVTRHQFKDIGDYEAPHMVMQLSNKLTSQTAADKHKKSTDGHKWCTHCGNKCPALRKQCHACGKLINHFQSVCR